MYILSELFLGGFMNIFQNKHCKLSFLLVFTLLLTACQNINNINHKAVMIDESIYLDEYFHNYQDVKIETQEEIFALDDHMRLMV